jgi:hypothetical protein
MDFIDTKLVPQMREFRPSASVPEGDGFFLDNPLYSRVDADLLYGILRWAKPKRMIELGSGFSTLVASRALTVNAEQGSECEYNVYDPYPSTLFEHGAPSPATLVDTGAAELPLETFEVLEAGDVLFVDTTHTVKIGGDVDHLINSVLPRIRPGVLVHFHDIFLPWEYPREWIEDARYFWAEQYLLQAFLAFNPRFEVLCAAHALTRSATERMRVAIPGYEAGRGTVGAFWLRATSA